MLRTIFTTSHCLFQFPVNSSLLKNLIWKFISKTNRNWFLNYWKEQDTTTHIPDIVFIIRNYKSDGSQTRVILELDVEIKKHGWYFLEVESANDFKVPLYNGSYWIFTSSKRAKSAIDFNEFYVWIFTRIVSNSPCVSLSQN